MVNSSFILGYVSGIKVNLNLTLSLHFRVIMLSVFHLEQFPVTIWWICQISLFSFINKLSQTLLHAFIWASAWLQ